MHVHNLCCDADGQSHFRDIEIELSEPMLGGVLSKPQAVSTLMFRQTTASDGEARVLGAGEVMLVEDTTGKGHQAKTLEGAAFRAIL